MKLGKACMRKEEEDTFEGKDDCFRRLGEYGVLD